ncbi:hypothetical protein BGZ95_011957 [Linnemannia exigua]|uniref:Uncharacterized protein n=1 Tax=Linnemannia exigua TaxID=604196 RepID=A0AAD4H4W4_9FUNG|nr:hypothetical protein BGZ95_011957 [Linnemannia exigua]
MDTKETHALSLPEIVVTIGKAIPLWVPEYVKGETVWYLRPKDLIAASKINRLFHTVLTPILWTVYANPCDRSRRRSLGYYIGHGLSQRIRTSIIEKNSVYFRNNADTLEELELLSCQYSIVVEDTPMNEFCNDLELSPTSSKVVEEERRVEGAQLDQGQSLLLPRLKSFRVDFRTNGECCPNLRSVQIPEVHFESPSYTLISSDVASCLVDACAPGNMVHAALRCDRFESKLRDSLLIHRDKLEVLELGVYLETTTEALENICQVVEGCRRLKRLSVYNYSRAYKAKDASILLAGMKGCFELEHLVLAGFPFIDRTSRNARSEKVRTEQFLNETKDEVHASVALLPPGWRYSARGVAGSSEASSIKMLRDMTFEAVCHLSELKTVALNRDWFDVEYCSSSEYIVGCRS